MVLYITNFFITSAVFPENTYSVLTVFISIASIISFYVMTVILSPSKGFLIGVSIYFTLAAIPLIWTSIEVIHRINLPDFIRWTTGLVMLSFLKPVVEFYELINRVIFDVWGVSGLEIGFTLIFIPLFYIVCFASWYFKSRKDEKNENI
ncbi:MAG: hypothetical protein J6B22_05240 [Clostridia bacterium]|nr:hypothetical protein [Clostridia bacterium]